MMACKSTGHESPDGLNIKQVYAGGQCGGQDSRARLQVLSNRQDLENILSKDSSLQIEWQAAGIKPGFDSERILFISMGLKRSGGYGLELLDGKLQLQHEQAIIRLRWIEPLPGSIVTQALTSPCLFVTIPRRGYKAISVVDAAGKIRLEATLNIQN